MYGPPGCLQASSDLKYLEGWVEAVHVVSIFGLQMTTVSSYNKGACIASSLDFEVARRIEHYLSTAGCWWDGR